MMNEIEKILMNDFVFWGIIVAAFILALGYPLFDRPIEEIFDDSKNEITNRKTRRAMKSKRGRAREKARLQIKNIK